MKYILLALFVTSFFLKAQNLPNENIKNLEGKEINLSELEKSEKPIVLAFWATWCIPCMEELSQINDKMIDWQEEANFDFYAVSTDDARSTKKVKLLVNAKAWDFNVLLDDNQSLKRNLNVNNIPNTFVFHKGELVYTHVGYALGEEDELFEVIKGLSADEK